MMVRGVFVFLFVVPLPADGCRWISSDVLQSYRAEILFKDLNGSAAQGIG